MKALEIGNAHEVGPKLCKALGLDVNRVTRLIIDLDASDPQVRVYVELIGDKIGIDAVLSVLLPFQDTQAQV